MNTKHQSIREAFPDLADAYHDLKTTSTHFQNLISKFDELNAKVHSVNDGREVMADISLEKLKKEKLSIKDEIYQAMVAHKAA